MKILNNIERKIFQFVLNKTEGEIYLISLVLQLSNTKNCFYNKKVNVRYVIDMKVFLKLTFV